MAQTCQHCGAVSDDDSRVMCPSCGRRMQPAGGASAAPPPEAPAPPSPYGPPPGVAPTPSAYIGGEPAYAPYATAESAWPTQVGPPGVDVEFRREAIARTSRLTVAFRVLLALPHLLVLTAIGYAVALVAIVAWFAALFTARVPQGIYGFIGWVVRYGARVSSYLWLLTDRWPTFSESDEDPVQVRLPGPQRLNRAAVFFRLVLLVPAAIVSAVLSGGLAVVGFFVWLIVLIRGRVPQPVFDATASALRYQTRFYAYATLLTARYPSGVYGDQPATTLPDTDALAPPQVNRAAKRMIVLLLVLGALANIGYITVEAIIASKQVSRALADNRLADAYRGMNLSNAATCIGNSDELTCVRDSARQNAGELRTFRQDLDNIKFPSDTSDDVHAVREATDRFIADFDQLAQVSSLQAYQSLAGTSSIASDGRAFDAAVTQLSQDLEHPSPNGP